MEFIKTEGLSGSVDHPMYLYWKDLMKMYPNAKVLLTVNNTIRLGLKFIMESTAAATRRKIVKTT